MGEGERRRIEGRAGGALEILSVGTAVPPHYYSQEELLSVLTEFWRRKHHNPARVAQFHRAVQVEGRHLALPRQEYEALSGFGQANAAFAKVGLEVGEIAIRRALGAAGLAPTDIDAIFFTTVTGLAVPSLDARLHNRLRMRTDVRRWPFFGLGCVAGAAGIARMADYLQAWPDHTALLLSVELCSLTIQPDDMSVPNLIASGLFGDGAAAVIGVGSGRAAKRAATGAEQAGSGRQMRVRAWGSRFYPDTEHVMGWDIRDRGFGIVLDASVPQVVERFMGDDVDNFLGAHGLSRADLSFYVCHPGGPKVLDAFDKVLGLDGAALQLTRDSLRQVGNLSSASVLFVLQETMRRLEARASAEGAGEKKPELGLMMAMGPGFCSELVLLEWA